MTPKLQHPIVVLVFQYNIIRSKTSNFSMESFAIAME